MNEQHLFFDQVVLDPLGPSLVNSNTDHLVIYFDDGDPSNDHVLVGKRFEWRPLLWMQHEKERLDNLRKLTIIVCSAILSEQTKNEIKKLLTVEVHFYDLMFVGSYMMFEGAKMLKQDHNIKRSQSTYFSIGTMRLPRFVVCAWLQRKGISVGRPKLNNRTLDMFKQQVAKFSNFSTADYTNIEVRFFGKLTQKDFSKRQAFLLNRHKIAIVSCQPWFDKFENYLDEKFTEVVAAKCLPLFVGNGNDNQHILRLGFKPYVGFDYSALVKKNFVDRWLGLLNDNSAFLLENYYNEKIYEMNKEIIDFNYNHLIETDWVAKAKNELLKLPASYKDNLLAFMPKKFSEIIEIL